MSSTIGSVNILVQSCTRRWGSNPKNIAKIDQQRFKSERSYFTSITIQVEHGALYFNKSTDTQNLLHKLIKTGRVIFESSFLQMILLTVMINNFYNSDLCNLARIIFNDSQCRVETKHSHYNLPGANALNKSQLDVQQEWLDVFAPTELINTLEYHAFRTR